MKFSRFYFVFWWMTCMSMHGLSQSENELAVPGNTRLDQKRWSITLSTGVSFIGPSEDVIQQMKYSSFGDINLGKGRPDKYAFSDPSINLNIDMSYFLSGLIGIRLNAGVLHQFHIKGYDYITEIEEVISGIKYVSPIGKDLRLKSSLKSISLSGVLRTGAGKNEFSIGPAMAYYGLQEANKSAGNASESKAGLNIGYTVNLNAHRNLIVALKANYFWFPEEVSAGPFIKETSYVPGPSNPPITTISTFPKTSVSLSTLTFGISAGWRF